MFLNKLDCLIKRREIKTRQCNHANTLHLSLSKLTVLFKLISVCASANNKFSLPSQLVCLLTKISVVKHNHISPFNPLLPVINALKNSLINILVFLTLDKNLYVMPFLFHVPCQVATQTFPRHKQKLLFSIIRHACGKLGLIYNS